MKLFGNPLKLVVFDADGVLIDLISKFEINLIVASKELHLPFEGIRQYFQDVREGNSHWEASFHGQLQRMLPKASQETIERLIAAFREEERRNPYPQIAGSTKLLEELRKQDILLGICTSNSTKGLAYRFEKAGIDLSWFHSIRTRDNTEFPKPHPTALLSMFKELRVPKDHGVYIGDWYPDLVMAKAAHILFLAVLSGGIPRHAFEKEGVAAKHIMERPIEILSYIQ
jgi:phosphoglycolate phosphatase-like HAD superfamily hydrolase